MDYANLKVIFLMGKDIHKKKKRVKATALQNVLFFIVFLCFLAFF